MKWLDLQVSLYKNHSDKIGKPASLREILFSAFERDLETIVHLRQLDQSLPEYNEMKRNLKKKLQAFTPAALMANRTKEINRTSLMQLDFDSKDLKNINIEELKFKVFQLPFVAFCGLSCSGNGIYALIAIEDPAKLEKYAEHCFNVFKAKGIIVDTSKGRNANDMRYISYDAHMLIREDPDPLFIRHFQADSGHKKIMIPNYKNNVSSSSEAAINSPFIQRQLTRLKQAKDGERYYTVGAVAITLGGYQHKTQVDLLALIKEVIASTPLLQPKEVSFDPVKYAECAFAKGIKQPLQ